MRHDSKGRKVALATAVLGVLLGTAGCEVTNPGPVQDEFLTAQGAQESFVNGAKERLTEALGQGSYSTAFISRELFPSGTTGSYGQSISIQAGSIPYNDSGNNSLYENLQQARWIGEEAVRRLTDPAAKTTPDLITRSYLWAAFANRMLGENYCQAVIDGGPLQPGSVYFARADSEFTKAIAIAPTADLKNAAYAGRAQVRLWLKNYDGAAADAGHITDLNYRLDQPMDFQTGSNADQRNHVYFAAASTPYRSFTAKFTGKETYYDQTGDPRTPYIKYTLPSDSLCQGSLQGYGAVPCLRPWKYKSENDPIRLASGREMRLIEAEVALQKGDMATAMTKINLVHTSITSDKTGAKLAAYPAPANIAEAWTDLKTERGIELWLEMRRMGDQRRWDNDGSPGSYNLPSFETVKKPNGSDGGSLFRQYLRGRPMAADLMNEKKGGTEGDTPRALCYNIADQERNNNKNIPEKN
jgi:hypothetical protein